MAHQKTATIIRQVGLSQTLAKIADQKAARLGISTPEYIRYLIVQDTQGRGEPGAIAPEAERQLLQDVVDFLAAEKASPTRGATTAKELVARLDRETH